MTNPYRWNGTPGHVVPMPEEPEVVRHLVRGDGVVVAGGRGMGKSMLLDRLEGLLAPAHVVRLELPLDARDLWRDVAEALGAPDARRPHDMLDARPGLKVVVVDEVDRWARFGDPPLGRQLLDVLEDARKRRTDLGIVVAGGFGVHLLRGDFGSPFLTRAELFHRTPFDEAGLQALAEPLGAPLAGAVVAAMLQGTGGVPAVLSYVLERCWPAVPTVDDVARHLVEFRRSHSGFRQVLLESLGKVGGDAGLLPLFAHVRDHTGPYPRDALLEVCPPDLDLEDGLDMLVASGLIRIGLEPDPVQVEVVPSVLVPVATRGGGRTVLGDVAEILAAVHRQANDLNIAGSLQPESVFRAILAVGLEVRGWRVDTEALQVAGRTDLRVQLDDGHAVVEVKRGRNARAHEQVCGYVEAGTRSALVVTVVDVVPRDYAADLPGDAETLPTPPNLLGAWRVLFTSAEGVQVDVHHLLVRVPPALRR